MADVCITELTPELAAAAAELEAACFSTPWSEEGFLTALASSDNIFLAAENPADGELIGYAGLYTAADEGEITNVAISPACRNGGIGRQLVTELIRRAKEKGIVRIYLEVRVSNEPAIRLYQGCGFVPCGTRKNFYRLPTEDASVMMCETTPLTEK